MTIFFLQSSSYKKLKSSTCYPFQLCLLMLNLGNGLIDMDQSICSWQTHFSKKKKKKLYLSTILRLKFCTDISLIHFIIRTGPFLCDRDKFERKKWLPKRETWKTLITFLLEEQCGAVSLSRSTVCSFHVIFD